MHVFNFISDPGHGWLQVGWNMLRDLNLNPRDFSRYSYRDRNTFYLEEDCDASKFVTAYQRKYGKAPVFEEVHQERTFIRSLPSIHS